MADCEFTPSIGAYHDGELDQTRRVELERHIAQCPQCSAELESLAHLSRLVSSQVAPTSSVEMKQRLHRHVDALTDRSVRRFAETLSGLAAGLLIVSSLWLMRGENAAADTTPPWESAANSLRPVSTAQSGSIQTAAWIVTQLQPGQPNE